GLPQRALGSPVFPPVEHPALSSPRYDSLHHGAPPPTCVRSRLSTYRRIQRDRRIPFERDGLSIERTQLLLMEERFGNPRQSGNLRSDFHEKLLCALDLDPLDERAGKRLRLTVYPLLDRSQTSGNFPVTNRRCV